MSRLKEQYENEIKDAMIKKFGYKNTMEVPKLDKIVVNMGVGEAKENAKLLEAAVKDMEAITGQKAVTTKAKNAIANFKIRENMPIGCKVTLRGEKMYEFADRLINLALPRVRDFRGVNPNAFDGRGNYALGIKEQIIFPEIDEQAFPEIVKFIDKNYRTIKSKSGRAIAGLSMGGFHSLHISKQYPDMFNYIGLFSAAIMPNKEVSSPIYENMEGKLKVQFDKNPALYWIAIGKTDFLYKANEEYRKLLDEKGYKYTYYESDEGHIWKNWRIYLTEFVPMLFR